MKTLAFLVALAVSALAPPAAARGARARLDSTVERLGRDFIRNEGAVGLSIGVYADGRRHFYNFGTTAKGPSHRPTEHTVYEIGSITKTFVSLVLANAVLEGRIRLDDDVRKYLKGGYPNLERAGRPIRIVDLANTTSSLPDWLPALPAGMSGLPPDSALSVKIDRYRNLGRKDLLRALHTVTLDAVPGTRARHSNAGAQLLAYILEDVYHAPMDDLIRRYVTRPNGMNHTFFLRRGEVSNVAQGYAASGQAAAYEFVMPYFKYAGGLASTTDDLVRYIELLVKRSQPAVRSCLKKTVDVGASSGAVIPMSPSAVPSPDRYSIALNWLEYQPSASDSQIWSDGGTDGFNSYLVVYPLRNSGVALLANKSDERIFKALPGLAEEISKALAAE